MLRIVLIASTTVSDDLLFTVMAGFNHPFMGVARGGLVRAVALHVLLGQVFSFSSVCHN